MPQIERFLIWIYKEAFCVTPKNYILSTQYFDIDIQQARNSRKITKLELERR